MLESSSVNVTTSKLKLAGFDWTRRERVSIFTPKEIAKE